MTKLQASITYAVVILTLLLGIQFAVRFAEYAECVTTRTHSVTSYTVDRQRIEETCKRLHLSFPF